MNRPVFVAFVFVIFCACAAVVGMIYFQTHVSQSSFEREGPGADRGVNEQVNQIMNELGKVE